MAIGLHPITVKGIEMLKGAARKRGLRLVLTSGFRDLAKQAELIKSGRAITPAAPGYSTHNYGFAFDAVASDPTRQTELGLLAESIGLSWGGRFNDPPHFQILTSAEWKQALRLAGL